MDMTGQHHTPAALPLAKTPVPIKQEAGWAPEPVSTFRRITFATVGIWRPGYLSRYTDSLRVGRSGDRIQVEARFSESIQTGPTSHPSSYTTSIGSFPRVQRPGVALTTHSHLAPRLKKEYSYTTTPLLGLRSLF
jgi:hypothetical protein